MVASILGYTNFVRIDPDRSWWLRVITAASRFGYRLSGKAGHGIFAVALAGVILLFSGCGDDGIISRFMLKPDRIIVERRPDPVYDQLFLYYVELCATSQFRSKLKGEGGVAGHAVMYIKGACKDEQAHSRSCDGAESQRPSWTIPSTVQVLAWAAGSGTSTGSRFQGTNFFIRQPQIR